MGNRLAHIGEYEIIPYENIHAVNIDSGDSGNCHSCTVILNNSKEIYIAGQGQLSGFLDGYKAYLDLMEQMAVVVPYEQE